MNEKNDYWNKQEEELSRRRRARRWNTGISSDAVPVNAITTQAGDPITTQTSDYVTTQ